MADHNLAADRWLQYATKDEGDEGEKTDFCIVQSRRHLLQIMYFSSQLLTVGKAILFVLVVQLILLLLVVSGYLRVPMS